MTSNSELIERLRSGDESAAAQLVENNMGLVYSIVGKFCTHRCEPEDLNQIGAIGLIKAVKKFDSSYGVRFSTYAVPMIIGEIKRFLRDDGAIKISRTLKENAVKGRRAEERLQRKLGRAPTISEISKETGIDESKIVEAFEASVLPESLYAGIGDKDDSNGIKLMELVASDNTEEKIVDKVFIRDSLKLLSKREYDVIVMRYFRGKTQNEIAKMLGVSQVQVSRIEKKAIEKMREAAEQ